VVGGRQSGMRSASSCIRSLMLSLLLLSTTHRHQCMVLHI
jgi:hypothetical protein